MHEYPLKYQQAFQNISFIMTFLLRYKTLKKKKTFFISYQNIDYSLLGVLKYYIRISIINTHKLHLVLNQF